MVSQTLSLKTPNYSAFDARLMVVYGTKIGYKNSGLWWSFEVGLEHVDL